MAILISYWILGVRLEWDIAATIKTIVPHLGYSNKNERLYRQVVRKLNEVKK